MAAVVGASLARALAIVSADVYANHEQPRAAQLGVCGDLTGDGEVDVADAITALQISVGSLTPT